MPQKTEIYASFSQNGDYQHYKVNLLGGLPLCEKRGYHFSFFRHSVQLTCDDSMTSRSSSAI
jgi:hypothetical protein